MLVTPVTEHLIRFVYEGSKESDPEAGKEDALITPDGVLLTELMEINSEPAEEEMAEEPATTQTGSSRHTSRTRKRAMSVVMRKQVTQKGIKIKWSRLTPDRESD